MAGKLGEQRKMQRRHLIYYLEAIDMDTGKPIGFLVDITTNGIMLMSEAPIEINKIFHLTVKKETYLTDNGLNVIHAVKSYTTNSLKLMPLSVSNVITISE